MRSDGSVPFRRYRCGSLILPGRSYSQSVVIRPLLFVAWLRGQRGLERTHENPEVVY